MLRYRSMPVHETLSGLNVATYRRIQDLSKTYHISCRMLNSPSRRRNSGQNMPNLTPVFETRFRCLAHILYFLHKWYVDPEIRTRTQLTRIDVRVGYIDTQLGSLPNYKSSVYRVGGRTKTKPWDFRRNHLNSPSKHRISPLFHQIHLTPILV